MIRTAIVVEGGAMRGIYSAGVLDALTDAELTHFDLAIGTSAGAANLASFVSGQRGRNLKCYLEIMCDPNFFSARRAFRGGHFMDLDWLWGQFAARFPLDEDAIRNNRTELVSTGTCAETGRALYHRQREAPHRDLLAGCALPLLYRGPVRLGQDLVVDGGVSDPIPAGEAYRRGARRILVVRSRPIEARKKAGPVDAVSAVMLRRTPALALKAASVARTYAESTAFVNRPPTDAKLLQLAPRQKLKTTRTTRDKATLQADYQLGYDQTMENLAEIGALLTQDAAAAHKPGPTDDEAGTRPVP